MKHTAEETVIEMVTALGFERRGSTSTGRTRFALPSSDIRLSVGPRSVAVYREVAREAHDFQRLSTTSLEEIWSAIIKQVRKTA